ncbi:MAG TPA: hypothetical protein VN734_17280 [Acidobacteriaceae bacterium]|nr:hypothetical protein [Acidobacteriaceae bacterium]
MSIDKSTLPPEVRAFVEKMEAKGVRVEVVKVDLSSELKDRNPFKIVEEIVNGASTTTPPNSETSSPASDEDDEPTPKQFVDTLVSIVKDGLSSLHGHLCPRIKTLEREARDARKDIDELKRQLATRTAG